MGSGEVSVLTAAAVYGLSTTLSVVALHAVRPADLLAVELAGAAAILLTAAAATGRLRLRGAGRHLLLGVLAPGLGFLLADLGLARTSASTGSLLLAVEPLLSVVLAVAFLRERTSRRAVLALAVGLAGSALVALDPAAPGSPPGTALGNVLILAGVTAGAAYVVGTRRYTGESDGMNSSAWQTTGGALSAIPFVTVSWATGGSRLTTASGTAWAACVAVVLCGAVAGVAINRGLGRVPAARAGQLLNLTPAVGTLTAVVLLGDRPTPAQLAGGVAILAGLALLLKRDHASDDALVELGTVEPLSTDQV